jgi:hypothetical protein
VVHTHNDVVGLPVFAGYMPLVLWLLPIISSAKTLFMCFHSIVDDDVLHIRELAQYIMLGHRPCQLQIAVVDLPSWVGGC